MEIKGWLRKHGSTVIVVDECQKLNKSGLEMLRDIHDISDAYGRRSTPIILFGGHRFKKLIEMSRADEKTIIEPQLARRLKPVLDIDAECRLDEDGGIYTIEDIVKIMQNKRVHILTPRATRWLRDLQDT